MKLVCCPRHRDIQYSSLFFDLRLAQASLWINARLHIGDKTPRCLQAFRGVNCDDLDLIIAGGLVQLRFVDRVKKVFVNETRDRPVLLGKLTDVFKVFTSCLSVIVLVNR
jgi:hypothetical protein